MEGFVNGRGEILGKGRSVCNVRRGFARVGALSKRLTCTLSTCLFVVFPVCFLAVARAVPLGFAFGAAFQGSGIRALLFVDDAGRVCHDGWW